jgi:sulfur-carrier protein
MFIPAREGIGGRIPGKGRHRRPGPRAGGLWQHPAMATVVFTPNLRRHVESGSAEAPGATVREVLDRVFAANPVLRGYVLDDQGALRHHMVIFVDGDQIDDRVGLGDPVGSDAEIYVMQALSGGIR